MVGDVKFDLEQQGKVLIFQSTIASSRWLGEGCGKKAIEEKRILARFLVWAIADSSVLIVRGNYKESLQLCKSLY